MPTGAGSELDEDIAIVQLSLVGLASGAERDEALKRLGRVLACEHALLANLVQDLGTAAPPGAADVLKLAAVAATSATREQRRSAVASLHRTAARHLPALWRWIAERSSEAGGWSAWWSKATGDPTTVSWMARGRAVRSAASAADWWGRLADEAAPRREPTWRWLQTGAFLGSLPVDYRTALRATATAFRCRDLLPADHRVTVASQTLSRSVAVPIVVPGRSVVVVSDTGSAADIRFIHHELAHVTEHAIRRADLPLEQRWSFDPVRSEGWALLCETLVHDRDWWVEIGLGTPNARVIAFHRATDEFSQAVVAGHVALDDAVSACQDEVDLRRAAREIVERLQVDWDPAAFAMGVPNVSQWRAYAAAFEWADAARRVLARRFGTPWWRAPESWAALRRVLETPGSAAAALHFLSREDVSPKTAGRSVGCHARAGATGERHWEHGR